MMLECLMQDADAELYEDAMSRANSRQALVGTE